MPNDLSGSWPRFRGASFDNIVSENTPLKDSFNGVPPAPLWQVAMGEGHAAPAVMNGRVYVLDYDEAESAETLRAFALTDGRELWRRSFSLPMKRNHGMSRSIPAVTDKYVVTIGPCATSCAWTR